MFALQAGARLGEATQHARALTQLLTPVAAPLQQLIGAIRHCISAEDGRILDRASQRLAQVVGNRLGAEDWMQRPSLQSQLPETATGLEPL